MVRVEHDMCGGPWGTACEDGCIRIFNIALRKVAVPGICLLGIVWAGTACRHVWWHFFLTCLGPHMKFFSSTQNRKDGKHGIMGTFITQHSLNRFLFRRWRIRSRFALAGPIWGNSSKTTAVCCVYANNFWYFLILSHFTQYTHLRFSIPHFGVFCVFFHFLFLPDLVVVAEIQELQRFQTGEPLTCLVMAPGGLEAPDGVGVHYKNIWNYQSWNPSWGLPKKQIIKLKHRHQSLSFGFNVFSCAMKLRQIPWFVVPFRAFFHGLDCWMW